MQAARTLHTNMQFLNSPQRLYYDTVLHKRPVRPDDPDIHKKAVLLFSYITAKVQNTKGLENANEELLN